MKKIEDNHKKYVTFSKRRGGLFKKAYELSVLCDTEVGLVVITPSGKFSFLTAKKSLDDILLEFVSRPDVQLPRDLIPHKESLTVLLENMKVEEETDVAGLSNQNATPSVHLTDQDIKNVEEKSRSILQLLSLVRERKDNLSAQLTTASSSIPSTAASTSYQCEAPNHFDWMAYEAQYYGPPGGDPGASSSSQPPLQMLTEPEVMQEDDGRWQ